MFKIRDERNKGYFTVDNVFIDYYAQKIGPHAAMVYMVLCRHADKSQTCFPSQEIISSKSGISDSTVKRKLKILEEYNMIVVEKERNSKGEWMHNTYTLMDKTVWKNYPEVTGTHGNYPEVTDDIIHRSQGPIKKTNIYKKTNIIKDSSKKKNYSSIKDLQEEDLIKISELYQVPISFVKSKHDDMVNWHESTGKRKKNWYATLRTWVKRDTIKLRQEVSRYGNKRGIDASNL